MGANQQIIDDIIKGFKTPTSLPGTSTIKFPQEDLGGATLFGKIIDVLSRGEYASANMARDYMLNRPFDVKSAIKGFKGEEKTTYDQLTPELFPDWSPWKQKTMGFALAVMADPLTYVPFGAIAKGTQQAGKALLKTRAGGRLFDVADKSMVSKAFRPSAGLPKDYYELKVRSRSKLQAENARIMKDVQFLRRGLTKRDMEDLMFYREHPEMVEFVSPKLKGKLEDIGQRFDDMITSAEKEGHITPEVSQKWRAKDVPYAPHYYPERGLSLARGEIPPSLFERVKKPSYLKKRVFDTVEDAKRLSGDFTTLANSRTLDEAQENIRRFGFGELFSDSQFNNLKDIKSIAGMRSKWYTPESNLLKAYGIRALEQAGFTARTKFVHDVLSRFGTKVTAGTKVVPEGMGLYLPKGAIRFYGKESIDADIISKLLEKHGELIPYSEMAESIKKYPSITKKVPTYMLPEEIAKDMNRFNKFFIGDPTASKMLQMFDKAQNAWKGMATCIRLPFHLRNMYSNWWQAYISGIPAVKLPQELLRSAAVQAGGVKSLKLGNKVYKVSDLTTAMEDLGVLGKGWIGSDIAQSQMREIESILKYGKLRNLNPFEAGRTFGTAIENNSRVAVFLSRVSKGESFEDSAKAVRKYLFDYTELTPFERNVMKRVLPFYTWSRKNIPLQIDGLLKTPQKYARYGKAMRAFKDPETPQEMKLKPEYFNKLMYIKSPFKSDKGKPVYMSLDLPPLEFNRMLEMRHWLSSLSPAKMIAEVAINKKFFPEIMDIRKQPLEKTRAPFWTAYLPEKVLNAMKDHHIVGEIMDRNTGKKILGMDKMWSHALQNTFPFMNELNRIHAQPVFLDDESPEMKWKSYKTGISQRTLDVGRQEVQKVWDEKRNIDRMRNFMLQHGRIPAGEEEQILRK